MNDGEECIYFGPVIHSNKAASRKRLVNKYIIDISGCMHLQLVDRNIDGSNSHSR